MVSFLAPNTAPIVAPRAPRELARTGGDAKPRADAEACLHCGLPLGRTRHGDRGEFCCAGCRTVHELLVSEGLERYYDLRGSTEAPAPELRPDSFAWLEALLAESGASPDGRDAARPADPDEVRRLSLDVQGVHCAACVWLLQELWGREDGGVDLRINPTLGRADVAWRPAQLDLRRYLRAVERFGYRFGPARKGESSTSRGLVVRLGVCFAAAANVMIFSLCYYAGLSPSDGSLYTALGRWSFALATIALMVGGSLFFVSAWRALRRGVAHLDLPIALGIALGYGGSVWAWIARGPEAAYFDTITIFITLMVLGRWLQQRVLERNRLALLASDGVDDLFTRRRVGSRLETIPAAHVRPGDELWIVPGDLVPVEGTLLGEATTMSLDWIDGESRPRTFEPGQVVPAGAFASGDAPARVAAREGFAASRLHTLLGNAARIAEKSARPGRADRFTGNVARLYVAAVLLLACVALAAWWSHGTDRAIEVALSVLVITCPCALGLATPLAHELVHAGLRRRGVFLRDPGALHRVLRVRHVLFDKTGTLTRGVLRLSPESRAAMHALDAESRSVLSDATARSLHPVSRALHAELCGSNPTEVSTDVVTREVAGRGLEIRRGESVWRLGSAAFVLADERSEVAGTWFARIADVPSNATARVLARFEFEEELKGDARDEVTALRAQGQRIHLVSGDRPDRASRVGRELGLDPADVHGGLQPEDKARLVRELDADDTWMVGDGLNDGPAFDAAFCAATPAIDRPSLPARSDLYYLGDGISAVRVTLDAARKLARVLRTNLAVAVAYNLIAVGACLSGLVGPLAAAVMMPASSLGLLAFTSARLSWRRSAWTS